MMATVCGKNNASLPSPILGKINSWDVYRSQSWVVYDIVSTTLYMILGYIDQ
jgi:hypothetical protein